jgi:menaquinone-dependent protoporphyrinogen oxidase
MTRRILVVYETRFGTCMKIAASVEAQIRARGYEFDVEPGPGARPVPVEEYAAVIVIAPIYNRRHPESIERFVRQYAPDLAKRPTAFISVSLGAASRLALARAGARSVTKGMLDRSKWQPSCVLYTGGSLDYPIYTTPIRRWMRVAAFFFGLPTDVTRRHELTRWDDVVKVVDDVIARVERA